MNSRIAVLGRRSLDTGIGYQTRVFCEMFDQVAPTSFYPVEGPFSNEPLVLPNGRSLPFCTDLTALEVAVIADVISPRTIDCARHAKHRVQVLVFDSDELPAQWVYYVNNFCDGFIVSTEWMETVARNSGIRKPGFILPLPTDVEEINSRQKPLIRSGRTILNLDAFHPRKAHKTLLEAFEIFNDYHPDYNLRLHSSLDQGLLDSVIRDARQIPNVSVTKKKLTRADLIDLLKASSLYVSASAAEGFGIPAREALASGMAVVAPDIPAYQELTKFPSFFPTPTRGKEVAHYPELGGQVFGTRPRVLAQDIAETMILAVESEGRRETSAFDRCALAHAYSLSFSALAPKYRQFLVDLNHLIDQNRKVPVVGDASGAAVKPFTLTKALSDYAVISIPGHDAGFFSVFNSFLSHVVFQKQDPRRFLILPDWRQDSITRLIGTHERESFCYGTPEQGNLWKLFFKAPYGLSDADLDDEEFLTGQARGYWHTHWYNEVAEPTLTYVHAYDLYRAPWFKFWRNEYHRAWRDFDVLPEISSKVDELTREVFTAPIRISAHVRHPSHIIEQPGERIAAEQHYFDALELRLSELGLEVASEEWQLFLATDQDVVVRNFRERYGENVVTFNDTLRSGSKSDTHGVFVDNRQVHHQIASNPERWTPQLGVEVIRDALGLAAAQTFLHVTSNVATAVSFMNPSLEMRYIHA